MKKIISDNIVWFVLGALALSIFAVYQIKQGKKDETTEVINENTSDNE